MHTSGNKTETPAVLVPSKPERLSPLENLALHSQYILIALLVLGAIVLTLVFGAP